MLKFFLPRLRYIAVIGEDVPEGTIPVREMVERPVENQYPDDYLDKKKCPATEFSLVLSTT